MSLQAERTYALAKYITARVNRQLGNEHRRRVMEERGDTVEEQVAREMEAFKRPVYGSFAEAIAAIQEENLGTFKRVGRVTKKTPFGRHIATVVADGIEWALHANKGWRTVGSA